MYTACIKNDACPSLDIAELHEGDGDSWRRTSVDSAINTFAAVKTVCFEAKRLKTKLRVVAAQPRTFR